MGAAQSLAVLWSAVAAELDDRREQRGCPAGFSNQIGNQKPRLITGSLPVRATTNALTSIVRLLVSPGAAEVDASGQRDRVGRAVGQSVAPRG